MSKPHFQVLRMGGRKLLATASWCTDHQGDGALSTKHGVDFCRVIDNLIHGQHDEIDRHNLHDRAQPEHGSSCGHTDKAIFDNRRIHHAFRAKFLQEPSRDFIRSLEDTNLLTHQ